MSTGTKKNYTVHFTARISTSVEVEAETEEEAQALAVEEFDRALTNSSIVVDDVDYDDDDICFEIEMED